MHNLWEQFGCFSFGVSGVVLQNHHEEVRKEHYLQNNLWVLCGAVLGGSGVV